MLRMGAEMLTDTSRFPCIVFHRCILQCIGRVANWHFEMPNKSSLALKRNLAVKILVWQFDTFLHYSLNLAITPNFGISLALIWQ